MNILRTNPGNARNMRILGLDYGSKTVGVAVSDPLGLTAQKVETIWRKQENKLRQTLARIEELIAEYEVEKIVLGFPKNMNNTVGERAEKALEFGEMLKKRTGLEVIMWDERKHLVKFYMTLCAQDKNYNSILCGLITIKKESSEAKMKRDIYETAIRLPKDLNLEEELALVTKAAHEVYGQEYPAESGFPE